MNTTVSLPSTRYLAVIGGAILLAALFLVARPMLGGGSEAAPVVTPPAPTTPTSKPTTPRPAPKPRLELLPGLPPKVANKLRHSKVVVVSLYQGNAIGDRSAVVAAASGAKGARAGFLAVNVVNERREGAAASDAQLVAQAAKNAR